MELPPSAPAATAVELTPPPLPVESAATGHPAGFWIRVAAAIIDSILIGIVQLAVLLPAYGMDYLTDERFNKGPLDFVMSWVLPALFVIFMWVLFRGTPGKLILGLRLIDANTGEKIDLLQGVIRYLGYFLAAIPLLLGILWVAWDPRKQGWHDKLAKTLVIRK